MKKLFLSLFLACSLGAGAQSEAGRFYLYPRLGVAVANMSNMDLTYNIGDEKGTVKSKYSAGLTAGAELEYRATDRLGVSLGVLYSQLGCRFPDYSTDAEKTAQMYGVSQQRYQLHYINVPLMLNGYLADGLAVKAGVQVGYLIDANLRYNETDIKVTESEAGQKNYAMGETHSKRSSIKNISKKMDVSIPIGISYEYMNVVLDARYNLGILKVFKHDIDDSTRNRSFTFTLGYKFAL